MQNYIITSKTNPQVKELRLIIEKKKYRDKLSVFVLEGAKIIEDTIDTGFVIDKLFITDKAIDRYPVLFSQIKRENIRTITFTDEVAAWVADTKSPQGIFAVVRYKQQTDIQLDPSGKYLLLEGIQDPGNVGTILRTALALGIDGVFITDTSAELYSPKVIRSSAGAVLKLKVQLVTSIEDVITQLKAVGITTYGTALDKTAVSIKDINLSQNIAVVMGNEGAGLTRETLELCDKKIIIPMTAGAQSLNVGVASALIIWEMSKNKM